MLSASCCRSFPRASSRYSARRPLLFAILSIRCLSLIRLLKSSERPERKCSSHSVQPPGTDIWEKVLGSAQRTEGTYGYPSGRWSRGRGERCLFLRHNHRPPTHRPAGQRPGNLLKRRGRLLSHGRHNRHAKTRSALACQRSFSGGGDICSSKASRASIYCLACRSSTSAAR